MARLSKRDVDRLTDVFLHALGESGMSVPREAAAETITGLAGAGRAMTEESVTELALQLLAERVAEKPGSDILSDPDSVTVSLHDVGQLVPGVGGGRVGDPRGRPRRRLAAPPPGPPCGLRPAAPAPDSSGRIEIQCSLLHRTSHTLRTIADKIEEGAELEAHDVPIRDGLVEQIRADADLAQTLAELTT